MEDALVWVDEPWPNLRSMEGDEVWKELCHHAMLMPTKNMEDERYQLWANGDSKGGVCGRIALTARWRQRTL